MFSKKKSKNIEKHSKTEPRDYTTSIGSRVKNLPELIGFSFKELPLPENYNHPLMGYSSPHTSKSFCTKLYLPKYIFLLHFEFLCAEENDALPKVTDGKRITEEEIDYGVDTKQRFPRRKVEYESVRRVRTECILKLGDLPLDDYLKTYGKGLENVDEFLAIYASTEKAFQRDIPLALGKRSEFSFSDSSSSFSADSSEDSFSISM